MSQEWSPRKERVILSQKQDNLKKAEDLVVKFPDHETIRLAVSIPWGIEIEVYLHGLNHEEKIKKIYKALNNYIQVE